MTEEFKSKVSESKANESGNSGNEKYTDY